MKDPFRVFIIPANHRSTVTYGVGSIINDTHRQYKKRIQWVFFQIFEGRVHGIRVVDEEWQWYQHVDHDLNQNLIEERERNVKRYEWSSNHWRDLLVTFQSNDRNPRMNQTTNIDKGQETETASNENLEKSE